LDPVDRDTGGISLVTRAKTRIRSFGPTRGAVELPPLFTAAEEAFDLLPSDVHDMKSMERKVTE
jgi:hypothetical protein